MASLDIDSSIDSLLRGLTDRSNVESTLILSRKDGSIIKTAGFTSGPKRQRALSTAVDSASNHATSAEDAATVAEQKNITPAEELAASVFQFMKSAGTLGATLASVSTEHDRDSNTYAPQSSSDSWQTPVGDAGNGPYIQSNAQVQLLRLRIRHREIIIYPDPQYICCVVQRVGKQSGRDGR